jgi:LacI family transcriptional regulator
LDYRPNALARSLLHKRTHTLGLLITDIANSFFAEIMRGIEEVCRKERYSLFVCNTDRNPQTIADYIGVLRENRVDGVLVIAGGVSGPQPFDMLPSHGIPVVVLGRFDAPLPAVRIDYVKGGWAAATHLIELGHTQTAVLLGPTTSTTSQDLLRGYRQALSEQGLALSSGCILHGNGLAAGAMPLAERVLSLPERPTGIFASNDNVAMGVIRAALDLGLRVPQDVSVIGCDGIQLGSFMNPALTTLRLPIHQMGVTVADMILRLIAGETVADTVWFQPELVVRGSTAPPTHGLIRRASNDGSARVNRP